MAIPDRYDRPPRSDLELAFGVTLPRIGLQRLTTGTNYEWIDTVCMEKTVPKLVFVVDDNPGDLELIRQAFRAADATIEIETARDGVEAIVRLTASTIPAGPRRPDLILFDLNLPRFDGRELLVRIKADEALRRIPVVVMTSSKSEDDIVRSYDAGANCYIAKPLDVDELFRVVSSLGSFWFSVATLSPR